MNNPRCRFCNAEPEEQSIKGKEVYGGRPDQHFWRCNRCEMIYLSPVEGEHEEARFYADDFASFMQERSGGAADWSAPERHFAKSAPEVRRRLPFLHEHLPNARRILEIGCSSGFLLNALGRDDVTLVGVEPSVAYGDFARSKGIEVYPSIEALREKEPEPFDLIIHYYVLEHIRNPVAFLAEIAAFGSKGGIMLFEVPSATEPLIELYNIEAFDRFYWSKVHHWYFTPKSLTNVLEQVGRPFRLFPEQRYDLSNHMVWMHHGKPGGMGRYADVFGEELDRLYKERLKKAWLCDTIVAVMEL